jgi:hypothetical protein
MRSKRLVFLFATVASLLRADGSPVGELPRVDAKAWRPEPSEAEAFSSGELSALHKAGYDALTDLSAPPGKGVSLYERMAGILSGSHDIESARSSYMDLMRELAFFSVSRNQELASDDMIESALSLARTEQEKSLVHFLNAWHLADSALPEHRARAGAEFALSTAIESPRLKEQMLLRYLKWAEEDGVGEISENGELKTGADYEKALEICERIASAAKSRETIDYAVDCVKRICKTSVELDIPNAFRTGSQAQFALKWRNCENVDISVYSVKLDQIPVSGEATDIKNLASSIVLPENAEPVRRVTMNTQPTRKYYPVGETARMDDLLLPGAYLVKAVSGDYHAEDLLFITDSVLTVKAGRTKVLAFACNAQTGKPLPGAEITLWSRKDKNSRWFRTQKNAGPDGVASFTVKDLDDALEATSAEFIAILAKDQQQAMASYVPAESGTTTATSWSARIFTDCDDYQSGNTVRIMSLVRKNSDGATSITPGEEIKIDISGPAGFTTISRLAKIDKYGMAGADIALPSGIPVGTYQVTLSYASDGRPIGRARDFSVHGIYSPDFKVAIMFAQNGADETFVAGSPIKGVVNVSAPFGGFVTGQPVEIQIDERPYDVKERRGSGEWKNVSLAQTHTNSRGESAFACQTSLSKQRDVELRVKAIVADSDDSPSVAQASILVTRQRFYADLHTDSVLYEQGKGVKLEILTKSAKGKPVACKGTLRLMRESWNEVWTDRRGHEISGDEMQEMRKRGGGWFSFGQNAGDYVLKSQGYKTEVVAESPMNTDAEGIAHYVWNDAKPGYYRFVWLGGNGDASVVTSERAFWVSGKDSGIEGYRPDRIRLVSDTSDVGSALTMITVPTTNQSVLVTTGADEIDSWSMVNLKGTAQALETKASTTLSTEYLEALCVNEEKVDSALTLLRKPESTGLNVSISKDRADHEPGEDVRLTVTILNPNGTPTENARVCLWITGTSDDSATPVEELFPTVPSKYTVRTVTSNSVKPFFQPFTRNDKDTSANGTDASVASRREAVSEYEGDTSDLGQMPTAGTSVWLTDGISDKNGRAVFNVKMPRAISRWKIEAIASHENGSAGVTRVYASTNEPLGASLNAPESIFAGDLVDISAVVANNQTSAASVLFTMRCNGTQPSSAAFSPQYINLDAYSTASADWLLSFDKTGPVQLQASAKTSERIVKFATDAFVKPDPTNKTYSASIFSKGSEIVMPQAPGTARPISLEYLVSASPSRIALGALPYLLAGQSQGSSEAAARVATVSSLRRLLERMHYDKRLIEDGMAKCGVATYRKTRLAQDLSVLQSTQSANGDWGWIDAGSADSFTTAYNLIMLNLCDGEVAEKLAPVVAKARAYAASELVAETQPADLRVMLLFGLASRELGQTRPSRLEARALVNLIRVEDELSPFALACLALSAKQYGFDDESAEIAARIRSRVVLEENEHGDTTAHWKHADIPGAVSASEVESTAMSVLALVSADGPKDALVEQAVRFIYENSQDGHWDGPRETSLCLLALRDLSSFSSETDLSATCAIVANGKNIGGYDLSADVKVEPPSWSKVDIGDAHTLPAISISRINGDSRVFASLRAVYNCGIATSGWSSIPGLALTRKFYKTVLVPTLLNGADERIVEMDAKDPVLVGDRLDALITIVTSGDVRSLMVELQRPTFASWRNQSVNASVACVSDVNKKPGRMLTTYADGTLAISFEKLPAGTWEIRYPVRVDYAGEFTTPSAKAWVTQRPSLSAESDMLRVKCVSGGNAGSQSVK